MKYGCAALSHGDRTGPSLVQVVTVPLTFCFFRGLLSFLAGNGLRVICVSAPGEELSALPQREVVEIWPLALSRQISPVADICAIVRLSWFLVRRDIDILHAHTPKAGLVGVLSAVLAGTSVVFFHVHGFPFVTARGAKRRVLIVADWLVCRLAHRVFAVGAGVRDEAVEHNICTASRIEIIGSGSFSGVDAVGRFNPALIAEVSRSQLKRSLRIDEDTNVIGFVGRIVRDKGVVELARAWALLSGCYPRLHLIMVGDVDSRDSVPCDVLRSLVNHPRVHLVGQVEDVRPYYAIMDVLVLPTYREGLPYVPIEAGAMGLPVILSDIRGCRDVVVDHQTGRLVRVRDHQAVIAACEQYLSDPELRLRHGRNARERILREYRPDRIWSSLALEYQRAYARSRGQVV